MKVLNLHYKSVLGYVLLVIAVISFKLRHTISLAILNPEIITWVDVFLGIIAVYLVFMGKRQKGRKMRLTHEGTVERLRKDGEKIILTTTNCEVKENNYYDEVVNKKIGTGAVVDALYDPNRNVRQNYIEQSAIIYYYQSGSKKIRMTSQTFPFNAETLGKYLENSSVVLYVDRINKNEYAFAIEQ